MPAGHRSTPDTISLHRCFQRHGISRLPETQGDKPAKKKFKSYPIGYFHIDIAEVRTEEGKLYLFVAIDRTSKFAYAELHEKANRWIATDFLKALIKAVPYKIHTVLTDNGIQFTDLPKNRVGRRRAGAPICSTCSAIRTASSIGSRSQIILGPTARLKG